MKEEERLIEEFCQMRLDENQFNWLQENDEYKKINAEITVKLNQILSSISDSEQRLAIDELASAYNYNSAIHSTVAYQHGLKDGIKLMHEILEKIVD